MRQSLDQFSDALDDNSICERLEQMKVSDSSESDKYCKTAYEKRVNAFLDKFADRKHKQLVQLSTLNVS